MEWLIDTFRQYPSLAIFLTIGVGFWVGKLKFKSFSLGVVTSVLLVGVLVGQMDIPIPGPVKSVFFLLFLFSIGYSVGPQFFNALKGEGIKQVLFAVVVCVLCLLSCWGVAVVFGYNVGEAVGLLAGSQTISAVIGVSTDTIAGVGVSAQQQKEWLDMIPVSYTLTYIFGTIGSAYLLGTIGPMMLGGLAKVKAQTVELARKMNQSSLSDDPAFVNANRPVVFRAYKAESDFFDSDRTVNEIERHFQELGRRIFVERMRQNNEIIDVTPDTVIRKGDEIVLSGRRKFVIQDESWIGSEIADGDLLNFPVEKVDVLLTKKGIKNMTVDQLRSQKFMYGIMIAGIKRGNVNIPVFAQTQDRKSVV